MSDLILRPDLTVAKASIRQIDSTAVSFNPYTGDTLTSSLGGDRMGCSLELTPAGGTGSEGKVDRALMIATLTRMRGKQRRIWVTDSGHRRRGGFPTGELVTNNTFRSGTTGWTSSGADVITYGTDRTLRLERSSAAHTNVAVYSAAITVTAGAKYAARAFVTGGYGGVGLKVRIGTTAGGNEVAESALQTTDGMVTVVGTPAGTTVYFSVLDYSPAGERTTGMWQDVHYVSLSRCLTVSGGSQTGDTLFVTGVPTYSTDVCLTGDQVEVITNRGSELHTLTTAGQSLVGDMYLQFGPNMRGVPADGAAVIVYQPFGRFLFNGQVPEWMTEPGSISRASLDLVEAQ